MRRCSAKRKPAQRRGAAFILLVTAVLLVVLAASQALIRSEVTLRSKQQQHAESTMMLRALEVAQQRTESRSPQRFPVDDNASILIQPNAENTQLVATLIIQDQPVRSVQRPIQPAR